MLLILLTVQSNIKTFQPQKNEEKFKNLHRTWVHYDQALHPYICFDQDMCQRKHLNRTFECKGRKYKIFKRCAPYCIGKCYKQMEGNYLKYHCSEFVSKEERKIFFGHIL